MSTLNPRDKELVALGAALASNCLPCIDRHIPEARRAGLSDAEIHAALELADAVRKVPARAVLERARQLLDGDAAPVPAAAGGCAGVMEAMAPATGGCC